MSDAIAESYHGAIRIYQDLNPLFQNLISGAILALLILIVKLVYQRLTSSSKKLRRRRDLNRLFRHWIRSAALRDTDVRKMMDGYFFLFQKAIVPIIYIGYILAFYWGVLSLTSGNFIVPVISVALIVLLRETNLWFTERPSDEEINQIDPKLRERVNKRLSEINYDSN